MYPPRRNILSGLLSLGLTSCLGSFEVHHLNNTLPYEKVTSQEEITKINFVHLNAADLRGNTPFLFEHISEEESRYRAKWLAEYWRGEGVDIASINEIDYAGTTKTGGHLTFSYQDSTSSSIWRKSTLYGYSPRPLV